MRNKRRSILTGFGIFWGLFMLLFLLGGGQGVKALLEKNFEGFATNSMVIVSEETSKPYKGFEEGRLWSLQYKDVERMKMMFPEMEVVTPQISSWGEKAMFEGRQMSVSMSGVDADYSHIEEPVLKYGRFLNNVDIQQKRKVCIIGKQVYNQLFPEGGDPCGKYISVGSIFYKVIGVDFSTSNISLQGRKDTKIVIPISVMQDIKNSGNDVDMICAVGKKGVQMSTLETRIREVICREHYVDPTDEQALMLLNVEAIFGIVDNLFKGLNFMIWLIGLGTLLAGAIGVSNIMMVVVRERTIEIGIRRAIGATPRDILSQIIAEGVALTFVAGMFGIVFSVFILNIFEKVTHNQVVFQISFGTAISAFLLIMILGLLAGIAPAYRAMHIKPVDAMKDE